MKKTKAKGSLGMQWLTTGVSTMLVLLLLGVICFFVLFARNLSDIVKENLTVTVLLSDAAEKEEIDLLKEVILNSGYANGLQYISKEQALKEQVEAMGSDPSEFLGANPFTASLEMRMNARYANTDSLSWIGASLRQNACVEDVIYQKDLTDAINRNLKKISYVLLLLAVLLTMVTTALINNTIKLSVHSGRFVIRTMMLIGADWGVIRRPFMARGFRLGLFSSAGACIILWFSVWMLLHHDITLQPYITANMMISVCAVVLGSGLLLTLISAYFSVNGFLKRKACELY